MSYLALYRKYRPTSFDDVIDQRHITQTLINQIKNDKIGHAYLFCGSRGTGKTSTAKIFARSINCENPQNGSFCGECSVCKAYAANSMDILEIDAASNNGVDEIRDLREKIKYPPVVGRFKVYIIDEVHMLTPSAFNALLKTLEEPPSHAVFVLATTEVHKLPATILSRCMRFDFKLVSTEAISKLIQKIFADNGTAFEARAVDVIARAGEGSVRDALSIADMVVSYSDSNVTYSAVMEVVGSIEKDKLSGIVENLIGGNIGKVLIDVDNILGEGKSPLVLSKEIVSYLRDLLVILSAGKSARDMVLVPDDIFSRMSSLAKAENYEIIVGGIEKISEVEQDLRYSVHPKIVLETSLIRAMNANNIDIRVRDLEEKLAVLEEEISRSPEMKITHESFENEKNSQLITDGMSDEERNENRDLIFGELLKFLRKNSHLVLYTLCTELDDVRIEGNKLILKIEDEATMKIVSSEANTAIFDDFFSKQGMGYIFDFVSREDIERNLASKFGQSLKVID